MQYNFTTALQLVLRYARLEALRLGADHVGTEHILLGYLTASDLEENSEFRSMLPDAEAVRVTLEDLLHRRPRQDIGAEDLPYTSRAKKVLEFAMAEAREFNHTTLTPEHLLLGLLREEKGLAAEALTLAGLTLEDLRPLVRDDFPEDLPSDIIETAGVNRGPRRLLISVELPMWADSDAVAELIAEFVAGLSQLHIYAGGEGLTVDGIEIDVTATVGGSA